MDEPPQIKTPVDDSVINPQEDNEIAPVVNDVHNSEHDLSHTHHYGSDYNDVENVEKAEQGSNSGPINDVEDDQVPDTTEHQADGKLSQFLL